MKVNRNDYPRSYIVKEIKEMMSVWDKFDWRKIDNTLAIAEQKIEEICRGKVNTTTKTDDRHEKRIVLKNITQRKRGI